MRYPIAAGLFYEADKEELIKQIKECFLSKLGPKQLLDKKGLKKGMVSAIVPHAGYVYSGMCAAFVYKEMSEYKADTVILLGTDHTGSGSGLSLEDWKTPLGVLEVDKEFCKFLIDNSDLIINEDSHSQEHSIEVQLPFLQYIYNHKFRIVPINASHDIDYKKTADVIFNAINKIKKNYAIMASSDFTHYGYNYGYVPFDKNIKENLEKLDKKAIEFILKSNPKGFIDYVGKTKATICGKYGINVLIELNKSLGLKGKLLKYYTSGDIIGDYSNSVSYASIFFK